MFKLNKRAQTTAEYAILIAIVIGAVVAMQIYVRRGLQGRMKAVVDDTTLGGQLNGTDIFANVTQYEPYYQAVDTQSSSGRQQQERLGQGSAVGRKTAEISSQSRQQIQAWDASANANATSVANVTATEVTTAIGTVTMPAVSEVTP